MQYKATLTVLIHSHPTKEIWHIQLISAFNIYYYNILTERCYLWERINIKFKMMPSPFVKWVVIML